MVSATEVATRPRKIRVPGLDPSAPYFSRLSARSALFTDLRLLLEAQDFVLSSVEYRKRVIEENCLARKSVSARRKLWKELHSRYQLDVADPLFSSFWTEWRRSESETEKSLTAYVLFAMNDRLVADLGTDWLFPLIRRAPAEIRVEDVRAFIARSAKQHPEVLNWSEQTMRAVAQKYCASIRDFGLATGAVNKKTVRPALYGAPVRLMVTALRLVDTPLMALVQAPAFRLLGIDISAIINALGELNRQGELRFKMQGDVVEIELLEAA